MHVSSNSYGATLCAPRGSSRRRDRRRLQTSSCPFNATASDSPCTALACGSIDWSNPSPSQTCETAVARYCQSSFGDPACTTFLDYFVQCEFNGQDNQELEALVKGVKKGRNGKGIVYVYAAGNEYAQGSNLNYDGALNSRFTITAGAVDKDGMHASYSTNGAPLFVSAPGGGVNFYTNNVVALAGGGCWDAGVGTSYATPIVAGVVALMLQVNPDLTWRDVQGVLASTSQKVQPSDPSWSTNAAGFHHSYLYGFGVVDAGAAVKASKS